MGIVVSALTLITPILPVASATGKSGSSKESSAYQETDEPPSLLDLDRFLAIQNDTLASIEVGTSRVNATISVPKKNIIPSPQKVYSSEAKIIGYSNESCIVYAKRITGITKSIGYAGTAKPEGQTPKVGSIALEVKYGHGVAVIDIKEKGIIAHEANFVKGTITERFIPYSDIRGYIY